MTIKIERENIINPDNTNNSRKELQSNTLTKENQNKDKGRRAHAKEKEHKQAKGRDRRLAKQLHDDFQHFSKNPNKGNYSFEL